MVRRLERGEKLFLRLWDDENGNESGNSTMIEPYNAIPAIGVMVSHNWIDGNGFLPQTPVTVSVNGGAKGTKEVTADDNGYIWLEDWRGGKNYSLGFGTMRMGMSLATVR